MYNEKTENKKRSDLMKPSVLHIGALSILVISSLSNEARGFKTTKGGVQGRKLIQDFKNKAQTGGVKSGRDLTDQANLERRKEQTRQLSKKEPKPSLRFEEPTTEKLSDTPVTKGEIPKIADVLSKNSTVGITKQQIAEVFNSSYTRLGVQLKKIAEKIEKDPKSVRKKDLDIMLEHAINLKGTGKENAPANLENPIAVNVMRDLANNMYSMTFWHPKARNNALKLIGAWNANVKQSNMLKDPALNKAFKTEENLFLPRNIIKRKKEIREKCRI